jgi:hypothetical protein
MSEALQNTLKDISEMKVLPDADLQFLIELETTILQKLRAPIDSIMGNGQQAQPQQQGQQMPGMSPGGGAERVTGTRMMPPTISPDEFSRMMG